LVSPQEIVERRDIAVESFLAEHLAELNGRIAEISTRPVESINGRLAAVRTEVEVCPS
jgi:hypothetical protein